MKRKRIEDDEDQIRNLSLQWIAEKRAPREGEGGVSDIDYNYMSNRPYYSTQRRDYRFHYQAQNSGNTIRSNRGGLVTKSDPTVLFGHKTRYSEDGDQEDDWISQLGAQYMSRKKVHGEYGSSSNYGGCYSEREHATRRNRELDDSWIADFGTQWMKSRSQIRDQRLYSIRNVRDDSWISELGYEWMSRSKGRDSLTLAKSRLPDLSSQYTNRRNVHEDEWFSGLGSTYRTHQRNLIKDSLVAELGSQWETRRKLDYTASGSGITAYHTTDVENIQQHGVESALEDKTGHDNEIAVVAEPPAPNDENIHRLEVPVVDEHASGDKNGFVDEVSSGMEHVPQDKDEVNTFDEFQVLESSPFEDEFPSSYVNLESPAHSP